MKLVHTHKYVAFNCVAVCGLCGFSAPLSRVTCAGCRNLGVASVYLNKQGPFCTVSCAQRSVTLRRLLDASQDAVISQADQDALGISRMDSEPVRHATQRAKLKP